MILLDQRCFHHDGREAVAQCPSCKLFFCRECVTEHDGRMICRTCVNALTRDADKSERAAKARWTVTALLGLLIAWLVFYYLGLALARIPSKFHGETDQSAFLESNPALMWGRRFRLPSDRPAEPRPQGVLMSLCLTEMHEEQFGGASFSFERRLQPASVVARLGVFFRGAIA